MLFDKEEYEHQGIWNSEPLAYVPITQWGSYTSPAVQTRSDGVALVLFVRSDYGSAGGSFRIGSLQQQHSGIATPGQDNNNALASVTLPTYAYRYGFNGKENDNEIYGTGKWQDYGMRMYDTRLGRFASPDPLIVKGQKYPWYSSYQFAGNKPIIAVDLDGLEEKVVITRIFYGSTNFDGTRVVNYEHIEANRETNREIFDSYSYLGQYGERGTLAVFEVEGKPRESVFAISKFDAFQNWVDNTLGQVQVYGSGDASTKIGEATDPNKRLHSVNFEKLKEYLDLFTILANSDLNKPEDLAVPDGLTFLKDIADAIFEAHKQERATPNSYIEEDCTDVYCKLCKDVYKVDTVNNRLTSEKSNKNAQDTTESHMEQVGK